MQALRRLYSTIPDAAAAARTASTPRAVRLRRLRKYPVAPGGVRRDPRRPHPLRTRAISTPARQRRASQRGWDGAHREAMAREVERTTHALARYPQGLCSRRRGRTLRCCTENLHAESHLSSRAQRYPSRAAIQPLRSYIPRSVLCHQDRCTLVSRVRVRRKHDVHPHGQLHLTAHGSFSHEVLQKVPQARSRRSR